MSFSLVGPWAFGAKLTSAQMNQLDTDHANALDKSVAGDSILGTVQFSGSGKIHCNQSDSIEAASSNAIIVSSAFGIITTGSGSVGAASAGGITSVVANGITPGVAGGISDGGLAQGIKATVALGIVSTVAQGITTTAAGGISDGVTGGILVSQPSGLEVQPGSNQNGILIVSSNSWVGYQVTRTVTRNLSLGLFATGWTGWSMSFATGPTLVGGATSNVIVIPLDRFFSGDTNGATLTTAKLCFMVKGPHTGQPTMPSMNIFRQATAPGSTNSPQSLYVAGVQQIPWPGSTGAWDSSGNMQNFSTTPNQNNVIDLTAYTYWLQLEDENTANNVAGNMYWSLLCSFTGITNSAPG